MVDPKSTTTHRDPMRQRNAKRLVALFIEHLQRHANQLIGEGRLDNMPTVVEEHALLNARRGLRDAVQGYAGAVAVEDAHPALRGEGRSDGQSVDESLTDAPPVDTDAVAEQTEKLDEVMRAGMLERKDLELDIALQAGFVWLLRQDQEEIDRVLSY